MSRVEELHQGPAGDQVLVRLPAVTGREEQDQEPRGQEQDPESGVQRGVRVQRLHASLDVLIVLRPV